jgi:hypothetical protein
VHWYCTCSCDTSLCQKKIATLYAESSTKPNFNNLLKFSNCDIDHPSMRMKLVMDSSVSYSNLIYLFHNSICIRCMNYCVCRNRRRLKLKNSGKDLILKLHPCLHSIVLLYHQALMGTRYSALAVLAFWCCLIIAYIYGYISNKFNL